jgi:hypothetical protein
MEGDSEVVARSRVVIERPDVQTAENPVGINELGDHGDRVLQCRDGARDISDRQAELRSTERRLAR